MTKQSLEDLLRIASQPEAPVKRRKYFDKTCEYYINKFDLKSGTNKVPTFVVYYHYRRCMMETKREPSTKQKFFRMFNQYFEAKRESKQRYYMLSDTINLTDDYIDKAKRFDFEYEKEKKNKARERSLPGTKP